MALTHWKKLNNPDYIGAYAFQPGEKKIVTVDCVRLETVNGPDGKREECTVMHFREKEKPLILNSTNSRMISKLAGSPYVEEWTGLRIVLGVEKVKAFGDVVDAVRVKNERPAEETKAPALPVCADCGNVIQASGEWSAPQIASSTKKRFGAVLCMNCGNKRKEAVQHE